MKEDKYKNNLPLVRLAQQGNARAMEELIVTNAGLVNQIARRFEGRGTDPEDLVQIGNIGLFKAIRSFDFSKACAFSTYAVPLIMGEIRRHLRDDGPVKVSRSQKRMGAMLMAEQERMEKETCGEVTVSMLAKRCGISPQEAACALDAVSPVRSLQELAWGEEEGPTLEMMLTEEGETERSFDRIALAAAIEKLPPMRRKIILLRYFRDYSQDKTAKALGLTQVKVSREEKKILAFLHQELS